MATKYHKITGSESIGSIAGMYGVTPQTFLKANPGVTRLVPGASLRVPSIGKGQAGYYQTGAGERKTVSIGGEQIRMGPNTSITPNRPTSLLSSIMDFGKRLLVGGSEGGDMLSGVRGAVPPGGGAKQASPIAAGTPFGQVGSGTTTVPIGVDPNLTIVRNAQGDPLGQTSSPTSVPTTYSGSGITPFKPSAQLQGWAKLQQQGVQSPVNSSVFNELVTIASQGVSTNAEGGIDSVSYIPRDQAILYADSQLKAQGYVYNPISKTYALGTSAPATTGPTNKYGEAINIRTDSSGRQAGDRSTNYGQYRSRAANGRVINRDTRDIRTDPKWVQPKAKKKSVASDGADNTGDSGSIWRIG